MKLTKCMYGLETNPSKTPFNLINGQIRADSLLNNAGWYNKNGERLGYGDISFKDISTIGKSLPAGEEFIILAEADTSWNLPSNLDRSAPGRDYVIANAKWFITKTDKGLKVLRPRLDFKGKPAEICKKEGVSYAKMSYDEFFNDIGFFKKAKEKAKMDALDEMKKDIMDVYNAVIPTKKKKVVGKVVGTSVSSQKSTIGSGQQLSLKPMAMPPAPKAAPTVSPYSVGAVKKKVKP